MTEPPRTSSTATSAGPSEPRRRFPVLAVALAAAVLAAGLLVLRDRLPFVRYNTDVGHADEAAYALQARSLAEHGTLRIPYVSTFFLRYSPGIVRYDDHWPPFLAFLLAPFFACCGPDASLARSVCAAVGALALPLATAWLAAEATRRVWAGLLAAALMLADPLAMRESLRILSDVPQATLIAAWTAAMLAARRRVGWLVVAAAVGAAACYAKGSELVLLPMLPALAVLLCGHRILRRRALWAAVALFLALLLPWWTVMWRQHGNPLHSTQSYVSAFYGVRGDWDSEFYRVYWGEGLPRLTDRFRDRRAWQRATAANLTGLARIAFDGPPLRRRLHGLALVVGLGAAAFSLFAWGRDALFGARRAAPPRDVHPTGPTVRSVADSATAILLVAVVHAAFVAVLWSVEQDRLAMPLLPLLAAGAAAALALLLETTRALVRTLARRCATRRGLAAEPPVARPRPAAAWPGLALCALFVMLAAREHGRLQTWQEARAGVSPGEGRGVEPRYARVARGLREAGVPADAVVMTRNPWELLFYSPSVMRGVGLPYAPPERIFEIARYYGVTHFIYDRERPGLAHFLRRPHPGLTRIGRAPYPIYALDWALFDPETAPTSP